jgi:hypothetical protein
MAKASRIYVRGIYDRFKYLAAWLPNANLKLGDVGIRDGEEFKLKTTLQTLDIPFTVRVGKDAGDFTATSKSGLSLKTKIEGEVAAGTSIPLGKAGIAMEFSKDGAFFFQAVRCMQDEIENKSAVGQAVIKMVDGGTWDPDWVVVDTLVRASSATIVVSISQKAGLELTARAPVAEMNLANLDAGLSVSSQNGDLIHFIASEGLSPLYRLSRVHSSLIKKLLGSPGAITFGGPAGAEVDEMQTKGEAFEEVMPD